MHIVKFLIAAICSIAAHAMQRWEFTGKSKYQDAPAYFNGSVMSWWNIQDVNFTRLVYGGAAAVYHNTSDVLVHDIAAFVNDMVEVSDATSYTHIVVHTYRLHHSTDYEHPLEMEIGLYDYGRRSFLKYDTYTPLIGKLYVVEARTVSDASITHKIVLTSDLRGTLSVMQHIVSPAGDTCNSNDETNGSNEHLNENHNAASKITLRALNYNIWHNSPPSWFIPEHEAVAALCRPVEVDHLITELYHLDRHLATVIAHEHADIIALQEVRLDNTFYAATSTNDNALTLDTTESLSLYQRPDKSGSQLMHLAAALQQVTHEHHAFENYNLIFQPAMLLSDKRRSAQRNEEGVALLIHKRYVITNVTYLLLPRNLTNKDDDHQRVALHASLIVQQNNVEIGVDVVTSHLSLSEPMRRISFETIDKHLRNSNNGVQLLLGDFNVEPFESSYQYITDSSTNYPFRDAWNTSVTAATPSDGFTYPTCKPKKRIDYILYRSQPNEMIVRSTRLIGTMPWNTTEEELCLGYREGLGMLDEDSPLWASDHFGLVAELDVAVY